jgi:hypothetical protein
MEIDDKRKEKRYHSLHLLHYICLDSDGNKIGQGMARTLNISETGLKVETHEPIKTRYIMFLSIGVADDIFDIKGQVVYCNRGEEGRFESGVEFYELDFDTYSKLRHYVAAYEDSKQISTGG